MSTEPITPELTLTPPTPPAEPPVEERDKYGRLATERIVELESEDAEGINNEVQQGRWQTYDMALHFVLARGFAEIKRTRDAALKLFEQRQLKAKRDNWQKLMSSNPKLATNADLVNTMLRELGIVKPTESK